MPRQLFLVTKRFSLCLTVLIAMLVDTSAQTQPEKSLYQRLGGYDVLASVVDDWFARQANDPQFARFFAGRNTTSRKEGRQRVVDFLCSLSGGPCYYSGKDIGTAHAGLQITEEVWRAQIAYLREALDKFKVPPKEKQELIEAVSSFKGTIVEIAPRSSH